MRILHVAPSIERAYGGPTQSLAGFIVASRTSGDEVHVAAPFAHRDDADNIERAGARFESFAGYGKGSTASSPSLVRWVSAKCRDYDVTHVHGLFNFISTFAARAAITAGAPVIIRPFGTLSRYTFTHRRGAIKRAWFERLERPNIARSAAIHFTTVTERDEAERHGLHLGPRAHVVPPPFVAREIKRRAERSGVRVLFLGRLHPVKNLEALLDAWPAVLTKFPDARLVIAGEGRPAYAVALERRAGALGISGSVEFRGFLSGEEKDDALITASLFVLPSHHENFGIAVIEAVAAGIPVVVSEHVQLRDFVAGNELGLIAGDSADSLAASMIAALGDSSLQVRAESDGRRLVDESFSPQVIGKRLSTMYLAAVNSHRDRQTGN